VIRIDLKPGGERSVQNPRSRGVVPVALLGAPDFDVTDVDPGSLALGPGGAGPATGRKAGQVCDVNRDGFLDLVLHFSSRDVGLEPGADEVCLEGWTRHGQRLEGCDRLTPRPAHRRSAR
jgi:hypothetical protein